jgi:LmbE family N-acetylglucosaminyl deacetylase
MTFANATAHPAGPADSTVADLIDSLGRPGVLLAVWAHPDDESFLGAGLMGEVARRGGRVVNVTATVGEHGIVEPDLRPSALGPTRSGELETALAAIGSEPAQVLGFGDGACEPPRSSTRSDPT